MEKGKISGRVALNRKRHNESSTLLKYSVTQINSSQWMVTSTDTTHQYTLCEDVKVCSANCHLKYKSCNICVHLFSCNCMDALINYTICKHIHRIARNHKSTQSDDITSFTGLGDCLPINEIHTAIIETVIPQQQKKVESIRSRIQQKLMVLTSMVQEATNHEALLSAERCRTSATSALSVLTNSTTHGEK